MTINIQGKESIFFIKFNEVWCPIACETDNSINESSQMFGTTTRDNEGWRTSIPTEQEYSIPINGQLVLENSSNVLSYFRLREMKRNQELIEWKRETMGSIYIDVGKAYIENISDANPADGLITFSLTLVGFGKPEFSRFTQNPGSPIVPLFSDEGDKLVFTDDNEGLKTID